MDPVYVLVINKSIERLHTHIHLRILRTYTETAKRGALARAIEKGKSTGGEKGKSGQVSPSQHPHFVRSSPQLLPLLH